MKKTVKNLILSAAGFVLFALPLSAREVTISVGAGQNWKQKMDPQAAIWLEDSNGNFIKTLYVTGKASKKNWIFGPKEGRPESLPVWYFASGTDSQMPQKKTKGKTELDAVTSATPKGGMIFKAEIPDTDCVIKAEFNTSFDYNKTYTKKTSGVNGQPSVIYSAEISKDAKEEITLEFLGTGSLDGSDGSISKNTEGLTTAKNIVRIVTITLQNQKN